MMSMGMTSGYKMWKLTKKNRGFGAALCDIQKAASSQSHHCMRQKTRLTVDMVDCWRISVELLNSCSHREQGLWKGPFLCDTWSSELSIMALQEAESGLKQWALYHYIANLGDGTADGLMMVVSNTLLRKQSTSQKGQSVPFPLVAGRSNGCFYMV